MAAIVSLNPPPRQWLFEACLKPTEGVWSHPACMLVRRLAVRAKSGGGPLQNSSRARGPSAVAPAFWSAPAERSGDGAFARTRRQRTTNNCRPLESGVALRFPPQSKTLRAHAGNRLSRQRLGVRPALWRFSSGPSVSLMRERLARASGGERAALQALREVRRRLAVAPVFGVR